MTIYQIIHFYDVDGGFGDAVPCEEVIAITTDKAKAEEYVKRYNDPIIYDIPYCDLWAHTLDVREIELTELDLDVSPFENDYYFEQREWLKERCQESRNIYVKDKTFEEYEAEAKGEIA